MPIAPIHDQGDLRETKEIPMRKFRGSGYFDPPDCCGFMILECARYVACFGQKFDPGYAADVTRWQMFSCPIGTKQVLYYYKTPFTRYNRLSNRLNNRLHRVNKHSAG